MKENKAVSIMAARCDSNFERREQRLYEGLCIFLARSLGEYLTPGQLLKMAAMLRRFRKRGADVDYSSSLAEVISNKPIINNRYIPRRIIRKGELAALLYNICPYALLSRMQTAQLAKDIFPNIFIGSLQTVNVSFTRFIDLQGLTEETSILISAPVIPEHTVESVESVLIGLVESEEEEKKEDVI